MAIPEFTTEELGNEAWKPVVGWEGIYSVSSLGRVRREIGNPINGYGAGRLLVQAANSQGYWRICLSSGSRKQYIHAHQLVTLAFIGPKPKGLDTDHVDGNKQNNRATNLEYVTARENHHRAAMLGLYPAGNSNGSRRHPERRPKGIGHWKARLTEDDVREIRAAYTGKRGELTILARKFQVRVQTIQRIITRRLWKHI